MEIETNREAYRIFISICLLIGATSYSASVSSAEKIPSFMQQSVNKSNSVARGQGCPVGMSPKWKILWSPKGNPSAPNNDIYPNGGPTLPGSITKRPFSVGAYLNRTLQHTFNTRPLTEEKTGCQSCIIKKAWFYMYHSYKVPENIWTGNNYSGSGSGNDGILVEPDSTGLWASQSLTLYPNPPFNNVSPNTTHPTFKWSTTPLPLTVAQLINNGTFQFHYAIGDDTNIRQTAILAKVCCIKQYRRPNGVASRSKASSRTATKFLQMMQKDKAKGRGVDPRSDPRQVFEQMQKQQLR